MKRTASSAPEKLVTVSESATRKPLSKKHREQLKRLADMPDSKIDFSDAPDTAGGIFRPVKLPIALRLDSDVLGWLRMKPGYQTRINQILRNSMTAARRETVPKRNAVTQK